MHCEHNVLRVMTYNIRACLGTDGLRSAERIARVIAEESPDIVALQEVDFGRRRSGRIDQAEAIAGALGMRATPGVSFRDSGGGGYGNAVLSADPVELIRCEPLPVLPATEPRSAMWVRIRSGDQTIDLINAHLSFRRIDRPWQINRLLGEGWLACPSIGPAALLCGDLNCSPRDRGFRRLLTVMADVQAERDARPRSTWPARRPFRRIDHLLVAPGVGVVSSRVVRSRDARRASDHCPLLADLMI